MLNLKVIEFLPDLHSPLFHDIIWGRFNGVLQVQKHLRTSINQITERNKKMEQLITVVLLSAIIALITWMVFKTVRILKNWASIDKFFTTVTEPEIKIILAGEDPVNCISNVKDHTVVYRKCGGEKADWTLVENKKLKAWALKGYSKFYHRSFFGYFFYGVLANRSIKNETIDASRWVETVSNNVRNPNVRNSIVHVEKRIWSLRAKTERRIVFIDLEIGGDSVYKIDNSFTAFIKLKKPLVAMFDRQGNFGQIIDDCIKEIVTREALKLTEKDLFRADGTTDESRAKLIFDPKNILKEIRASKNIKNSGYEVTGLIYHGFGFTPDSQAIVDKKAGVIKAIYARKEQLENAKANKKSQELEGKGKASAITDQIKAQKDLGVDPNHAATELARMVVAQAISGESSKVTTFIERGAVGLPSFTPKP